MLQLIAEIARDNVTREKILLCPDMTAAKFIQRQICLDEPGLLNLKFETVSSFLGRVLGFFLIEKKFRTLKPGEGLLILQKLVKEDGYFAETRNMPGFMQALWASIQQLRLAQVEANALTPEILGHPAKAAELSNILQNYVDHLAANELYDYARILNECLFEKALEKTASLILLPGNLPLMPLELEVLKIAGKNLIELPFSTIASFKMPISWRRDKVRLPAGSGETACLPDKVSIETFCATEPAAEIREIIRRIRSAGCDFEQVAIVPADAAYGPLICSQLDAARIPYTSSMAARIDEFRPGRLALNLCQWALDNFPAAGLIAMLSQGDMRLFRPVTRKQHAAGKRSISSQTVINRLRQAHVRGGRHGYREPLLALGNSLDSSGKTRKAKECRQIVKRISSLIEGFAETLNPGQAAKALDSALSKFSRINNIEDAQRLARIKKVLQRYPDFTEPDMPLARAMWWLNFVLNQLSENEPCHPDGKVLVTSPLAASFSRRKLLFYPGMTHAAMPGKSSTDPVIPDACRKLLPPLQTAAEHRLEKLGQLYCAWAEIASETCICVSMPMIDSTGAATSPSEVFTRVLKQKLGKSFEFSRLINSKDLPLIGHFSKNHPHAIDLGEWLWQKLSHGCNRNSLKHLFEEACPDWAQYQKSQTARSGADTPINTGLPGWDPKIWDYRNNPEKSLSASGIEELGGCPYAWFLNYVVNCMPFEQIDTSAAAESAWLDSMGRGKLLHEIFEEFMR
ncbi:MAG: hypothetical protein AB1403_13300, partial [Candidatus Riflebacteria bacterium]